MLMPKKVKYRKQQRGRMAGKAWRGSSLAFGDFGLKALECGWITDRQIEAARVAMTRSGDAYTGQVAASRPAGDFTPRVVPFKAGALVPLEADQILWQR